MRSAPNCWCSSGYGLTTSDRSRVRRAHIVALGDDLDFGALERIASKPEYYYHAPDAEDLGDIYGAIAVEIPCPAGDYWRRQ